ncbi:hypothetical protein EP331_09260 [bacterium]|nr:MAG: hypothetical protein EP331_09260 [bacterium]
MLFVNGKTIAQEVESDFLNRAFLHADGFFTTFILENGRIAAFERHIARLKESAGVLDIEFPQELEVQKLSAFIKKNVPDYSQKTYRCRVMVWRQKGFVYSVQMERKAQFAVSVNDVLLSRLHKVHLVPVSIPRIPSVCVPSNVKWIAGNNAILAQQQAIENGGSLALQSNINGFISETPIACVGWFERGEFFTPSDKCDCLPGTTLADFTEYLTERNIPVHYVEQKVEALNTPEWLVINASWGVKKLQQFDSKKVNYTKETLNLIQAFNKWRMAQAYVV